MSSLRRFGSRCTPEDLAEAAGLAGQRLVEPVVAKAHHNELSVRTQEQRVAQLSLLVLSARVIGRPSSELGWISTRSPNSQAVLRS
ncbi:pyruvate-flavodoxin oxidoreductase [Mycobacterium sp. PO1]|nr:pyruvate-flavodoxin oxidoreductase [Mycobacterium sp. PO1]GFM26796.1 pyruvate-flavodoxin oxidoreductase [Mycobacterium sp. PO2]